MNILWIFSYPNYCSKIGFMTQHYVLENFHAPFKSLPPRSWALIMTSPLNYNSLLLHHNSRLLSGRSTQLNRHSYYCSRILVQFLRHSCIATEAMFSLYRTGFCSISKVAPAQCEQELIFCCVAKIVPKRSQCEQKPYPSSNLQCSLLI